MISGAIAIVQQSKLSTVCVDRPGLLSQAELITNLQYSPTFCTSVARSGVAVEWVSYEVYWVLKSLCDR